MTTPVIPPATCPPGVAAPTGLSPALAARIAGSSAAAWRAAFEGMAAYWQGAFARRATPVDVAGDMLRWWRLAGRRERPSWTLPNEIVVQSPVARLRDFSAGARDRVVPTLVLPPQAGHDSCIVDYSAEQSQMKTIRAAGLSRAYSLDWIGATPATRDATVDDYLEVIERSIEHVGGPVNLIGDCQGGWLATIYAALRPEHVHTLTIAGAPIDFHAGEPVIGDWVDHWSRSGDLDFYRWVVALGGGVLKGEFMLNGFITIKPENEIEKQIQLLAHLDDAHHVARYEAFERWFTWTQDIPGAFYLWIVEHLFRDNRLVAGTLEIGGEAVDLARIEAPLNLLAGEKDHITPPDQVFAIADHASTPAGDVVRRTTTGGHLGLFMGSEALRDHWPPILAGVMERSRRPRPSAASSSRRARATTPSPPRAIPAP